MGGFDLSFPYVQMSASIFFLMPPKSGIALSADRFMSALF